MEVLTESPGRTTTRFLKQRNFFVNPRTRLRWNLLLRFRGIHLSRWVTVVFFSLSDMGIALPATSTFMGFYVLDEFKLSDMGICLLSTLGQDCIFMGFYDFNDAITAIFLMSLLHPTAAICIC